MENVIDSYIESCEQEKRAKLYRIREIIKAAAPEATEKLSWQMPTFYLKGNLVHFASHKSHLGFYPGSEPLEYFKDKLTSYHTTKGAVQFPYKDELPESLITEIVKFCVERNTK